MPFCNKILALARSQGERTAVFDLARTHLRQRAGGLGRLRPLRHLEHLAALVSHIRSQRRETVGSGDEALELQTFLVRVGAFITYQGVTKARSFAARPPDGKVDAEGPIINGLISILMRETNDGTVVGVYTSDIVVI